MTKPSAAEVRKWYLRARALDPSIMLNDEHYTFPGGADEDDGSNRHQAHRSLGARQQIDEQLPDAANARFWRIVGMQVHDLPRRYPHRGFIEAVCESGNLKASAKAAGITRKVGRGIWRRFVVVECGLNDPEPTYQRKAA